MLNKTETEEIIVFFVTFLSLVAFQLGGPDPWAPLATPMLGGGGDINLHTLKIFLSEALPNTIVACHILKKNLNGNNCDTLAKYAVV